MQRFFNDLCKNCFPLKIAINTRLMVKDRMDGIGWFTRETMPRIAESHPEHQFFFLFDRPYHHSFHLPSNVTPLVVRPVTRLPLLLKTWNAISVPVALQQIKPDLYLSPDGFLPPEPRFPSVVAIHDLNFEHFPELFPASYRKLYLTRIRKSAVVAARVLTVSEFSKTDICDRYEVPRDKVDVIYSGLNSFIHPPEKTDIQEVRRQFSIQGNYLIVSGTLHPRKNINGTIKAFNLFRQQSDCSTKLVFAGNHKWMNAEMKHSYEMSPFKEDIIFTGRVPDHTMNALIWGAYAMVFVSLFEGFGLPILEAAAAGIPVLTSDNSSMREIATGSALLVNPSNVQEIADGMHQITTDHALRTHLIESSANLNQKYSWDITAQLIWESLQKV
jgi:glycosyltransferase involved in cell wall biosynthesis